MKNTCVENLILYHKHMNSNFELVVKWRIFEVMQVKQIFLNEKKYLFYFDFLSNQLASVHLYCLCIMSQNTKNHIY